ncbi:unnamed protein product [Phyllotreta striolata]|uniref:Uncharacterized protein n=1 Tax=Phyllotreta striolata TaxID=444603 RepID=A0A9N9TB94_PHYSR|nr:unnamed protein product [Phyllotreta striolata]
MDTNQPTYVMFSPIEDFLYLLNNAVGGESTVEDLLLLVGTLVAFVAFILWCCFPLPPKEARSPLANGTHKNENRGKYNQLVMQYDLSIT